MAGPPEWNRVVPSQAFQSPDWQSQLSKSTEAAKREMEVIVKEEIRVLIYGSEPYPFLLRHIYDPPPILYVKGNGQLQTERTMAVVGSRRHTYYGEQVTRALVEDLVNVDVITVSGLARGIDSIVHKETLSKGGITWAVLGSGLGVIYPRENRELAESICERGLVMTEFPFNTQPQPFHFPRRNRIISGLSQGCVIIEGDEKSGALITCRLAAEQGREVFAVPGSIQSRMSRGPNVLIQNGAKLIRSTQDIVDEFPDWAPKSLTQKSGSEKNKDLHGQPIYENILSFIAGAPVHRDVLSNQFQLSAADCARILLDLELRGAIKNLPGGFISLSGS